MAMTFRKSRSMSELPGHLRVPILKRKDTERTQARLEAGAAGVAELQQLREQQQQVVAATMEVARQKSLCEKQKVKEKEERHAKFIRMSHIHHITPTPPKVTSHVTHPGRHDTGEYHVVGDARWPPRLSVFQPQQTQSPPTHHDHHYDRNGNMIRYHHGNTSQTSIENWNNTAEISAPDGQGRRDKLHSQKYNTLPRSWARQNNNSNNNNNNNNNTVCKSSDPVGVHSNRKYSEPVGVLSNRKYSDPVGQHSNRKYSESAGVHRRTASLTFESTHHNEKSHSASNASLHASFTVRDQYTSQTQMNNQPNHSIYDQNSYTNRSMKSNQTHVNSNLNHHVNHPRNHNVNQKPPGVFHEIPAGCDRRYPDQLHHSVSENCLMTSASTSRRNSLKQELTNGLHEVTRFPVNSRDSRGSARSRQPSSLSSAGSPPMNVSGRMRPIDKCHSWDNLIKAIGRQCSTAESPLQVYDSEHHNYTNDEDDVFSTISHTSDSTREDDDFIRMKIDGLTNLPTQHDEIMPESNTNDKFHTIKNIKDGSSNSFRTETTFGANDELSVLKTVVLSDYDSNVPKNDTRKFNTMSRLDTKRNIKNLDTNNSKHVGRRNSFHCEASLTRHFNSNLIESPIKDVDLASLRQPGPLHAVTLQFHTGLKQSGLEKYQSEIDRRRAETPEVATLSSTGLSIDRHRRCHSVTADMRYPPKCDQPPKQCLFKPINTDIPERFEREEKYPKLSIPTEVGNKLQNIDNTLENETKTYANVSFTNGKGKNENYKTIPYSKECSKGAESFIHENNDVVSELPSNDPGSINRYPRVLGFKAKSYNECKHSPEKTPRRYSIPDLHGTIVEDEENEEVQKSTVSQLQLFSPETEDSLSCGCSRSESLETITSVNGSEIVLRKDKEIENEKELTTHETNVKTPLNSHSESSSDDINRTYESNENILSKPCSDIEQSIQSPMTVNRPQPSFDSNQYVICDDTLTTSTFSTNLESDSTTLNRAASGFDYKKDVCETPNPSLLSDLEIVSNSMRDLHQGNHPERDGSMSTLPERDGSISTLPERDGSMSTSSLYQGNLPERDGSMSTSCLTILSSVDFSVTSDEGYHTCDSNSPSRKLFSPLQLTPGSNVTADHQYKLKGTSGSRERNFTFENLNASASKNVNRETLVPENVTISENGDFLVENAEVCYQRGGKTSADMKYLSEKSTDSMTIETGRVVKCDITSGRVMAWGASLGKDNSFQTPGSSEISYPTKPFRQTEV